MENVCIHSPDLSMRVNRPRGRPDTTLPADRFPLVPGGWNPSRRQGEADLPTPLSGGSPPPATSVVGGEGGRRIHACGSFLLSRSLGF